MRSRTSLVFVLVGAAALALSVGVFVVDPGTTPEPVNFDDTVRMGVSEADVLEAQFEGYETPKAQVFYSQYGFVVGYNGVDSFVRNVQEGKYERVLGVPTKVYVTDFSGTNPSPAEGGFVSAGSRTGWTDAEEAVYVVGANANGDSGDAAGGAVVPFSSTEQAERYADEYDGEVRGFDELLETEFDSPEISETADEVVERRSERADETVREAHELLDRNVSVTVGEGQETVQAAVDAAPNGTAVRVPEGVYEEHVTVDKSLTLVGEEGARVSGGGNGTVITVEADDAAFSSLNISGVGSETRARGEAGQNAAWDRNIEEAYGESDAGIHFDGTTRGLVHDTYIDTNSTGVLFSDTEGGVVTETTVRGSEEWIDGFMGVLTIRSPAVVQNSTFYGGRDSVYSHASDGLVVRDSYMERGRFGVHLMYTSNTLLRANTVRDKELSGLVIMTRPTGNYVVGNDVRRSQNGIATEGTRSYFAENTVVDNSYGMKMGAGSSVYTRNVFAHNGVGARASSIIPSNSVTENDFVDNEVQVTAAEGSMRIWGYEGSGNYWSNAPPDAEEFRPTDPVDSSATTVDGMATVRESPSYALLNGLETLIPGMRSTGVVDESPLSEPAVYGGEDGGTKKRSGTVAASFGEEEDEKLERQEKE